MNDKLLSWEEAVKWLKNNPEQQELVRQCYYDDPLDQAAERFSNSEEWQAVQKFLQPHLPGKVLDLGAGRGISSYAFAKAGCSVAALEPDPGSLVGAQAIRTLADSSHLPIQVIQQYGETLPFGEGIFDIVYGRAVLHHARDLIKLCREAARVLKSGGVFIATREHVISKKEDLQTFLDSHPLHRLYGGENAYMLKDYLDAIKRAGIKITKIIGHFESVINYAPMTRQEYQSMVASLLACRLGRTPASWLAKTETVQHFYGWYLSLRSNAPGRHYSFLAVKK